MALGFAATVFTVCVLVRVFRLVIGAVVLPTAATGSQRDDFDVLRWSVVAVLAAKRARAFGGYVLLTLAAWVVAFAPLYSLNVLHCAHVRNYTGGVVCINVKVSIINAALL